MDLEDGKPYSIELSGTYDTYPLRYRALRQETPTFSCRYYLDNPNCADPDAPMLLLLHGVFDESWYLRRDGYHPTFRVASADLPAHGASGPSPSGFSIDEAAEGLAALIDQAEEFANGSGIIAAGISIGAIVALRLAGLRPSRLDGLFLIEPPVNGERLRGQHAQAVDLIKQIPDPSRAAAQAIARDALGVPSFGGDPASIDHVDLFAEIDCPSLIIHGEVDLGSVCAGSDVDDARRAARSSVASVTLPGGHNLHATHHDAITKAAKEWWRDVSGV